MIRVPALAAVVLLLTGCAAPASAPGVTASVYQPRTDVAAGRIAVQVRNEGRAPVRITDARLDSTAFVDELVWSGDGSADIAPGRALDLRMPLVAADCSAADLRQRVLLTFADGTTAELEPTDGAGTIRRLHDEACLQQRVTAIVDLRAAGVAGGGLGVPAELVVVAPVVGSGTVTVSSVSSTTLLAPSLDGVGQGSVPVGVELGAGGPTELRIPIVANRCDAHALAEDKVGTLIPLEVAISTGAAGRLLLPTDDAVRAQLRTFFATYCGL